MASGLCLAVTYFSASACKQKNSALQMPGFFGGQQVVAWGVVYRVIFMIK